MKLYCLTEKRGNERVIVEGPRELPTCTETVSNFHVAGDEFVKLFGWLPVEVQTENKDVVVSSSYEILEDKIIKHIVTRDKNEEELISEAAVSNSQEWAIIRTQRDSLLNNSDKLVMIDRWEKLTQEEKDHLSAYRQALRDLPASCANPEEVIFPTL